MNGTVQDTDPERVPLGDLIEFALGGEWGSAPDKKPAGWKEARVVRSADFRNWHTDHGKEAPVRAIKPASLERRRLRPGDIIVEISGGGPGQPVGRCVRVDGQVLAETGDDVVCSNFCRQIRAKPGVRSEYLEAALRSIYVTGQIEEFQTQTTNIRNLQFPALLDGARVLLPSKDEQDRLIAVLSEVDRRVRTADASLATTSGLVRAFRKATRVAAKDGRLTAAWRESHSVDENGDQLLERLEAAPLESDEDVPATWAMTTLGDVVINHDGKRVPVKSDDRKRRQGPFPYYGASGVIDSIDDFLFDGDFLLVGEDGANLLARSTPIAFKASGRFWVNNHAHVLEPKDGVLLDYLAVVINGIDLQDFVTGSAQPKLTQRNLKTLPVPIPPTDEQIEVIQQVERLSDLADAIENRVSDARAHAEKTLNSCFARAVSGELVSAVPG